MDFYCCFVLRFWIYKKKCAFKVIVYNTQQMKHQYKIIST